MATSQTYRHVVYAPEDERTHDPGPDVAWQESIFVVWLDPDRDIGGVHRIAREPNRDGGRSVLQCELFAPTSRLRRVEGDLPLTAPDHDGGLRSGGSDWHVEGDRGFLVIREPELEADLTTTNFYPITDFFPTGGGSLTEEFAPAHYETAGRITGTVRLDGESHAVDGLYYRDHSWGVRKWDRMLAHRWVVGTFGPELSFAGLTWYGSDDLFLKAGYLVRDGEVLYADDMDIVTWMEADGVSVRGGEVTWILHGGEQFKLTLENVAATCNEHHGGVYVDAMCVTTHDGKRGVADFEISENPRAGTRPISFALHANITDGLSPR